MKKAEAISILATSARPREPKDRARYDEAVRMAIEALKCSETPNSSDCISRQAAIDVALEDVSDKRTHEFNAGAIRAANRIKSLPSAQPEPHWIPCSERVPVEGQKCLVCDKGSIGIDTYIGHGNPYNWKWYTRDYEAWLPLPELYKGGDAE